MHAVHPAASSPSTPPQVTMAWPPMPRLTRALGAARSTYRAQSERLPRAPLKRLRGPKYGLWFSFIYLTYGTFLLLSAYLLAGIANKDLFLGKVQEDFDKNVWSVPVTTYLHVSGATLQELDSPPQLPAGSESLADLQYDKCPETKDNACADKYRPNTSKIFFHLGNALAIIPDFVLPEFQTRRDFLVSYTNNLVGWNMPVVMFYFPDQPDAVVCSVRRAQFHLKSDDPTMFDRDSFAFCSKRTYSPDWFCENEVALDTTTFVVKILRGKASFVGKTNRGQLYFNPGATASLTGGSKGDALLMPIPVADEYNSGILVGRAPWDLVPSYNCKTFSPDTLIGWLYQGQGMLIMHWQSHQLMLGYAFLLWLMTAFLFVVQYRFLRFSSIPIGPIYMAKQLIPIVCMFLAVLSNYNIQVLTTFLHLNDVSEINASFYMTLGPAMMASISSIMISNVVQIMHNPRVVTPSWVVMAFSVANWFVVFTFEIAVVPRLSLGIPNSCAFVTSTSCVKYEALLYTYCASLGFSSVLVFLTCVAVRVVNRRAKHLRVPDSHSFLQLLLEPHFRELSTGTTGHVALKDSRGRVMVDPAILCNKNLIRVTNTYVVRTPMVKFLVVYEWLPEILKPKFCSTVGPFFAIVARDDRLTQELKYITMEDIDFPSASYVSAYCR